MPYLYEQTDLEDEINRQKLRAIEALRSNAPFSEIKKIKSHLKELQGKLLNCTEKEDTTTIPNYPQLP